MSLFSLLGAVEIGLIFSLVALGVFISFRLLRFPDLTVDGSFPLGGAVCAILISTGTNPWLATLAATAAGAVAGLITGWLNVKLKIMDLLASILMMIALYSDQPAHHGRPQRAADQRPHPVHAAAARRHGRLRVPRPLSAGASWSRPSWLLDWFFATERGLAIRATGSNARMARAQGVNTGAMILLGMALSNGLVGLAGALFAQTQGGSDISMGIGTIVIGLAAVIVGESILPSRKHRLVPRWPWSSAPSSTAFFIAAGAQQRLHRPQGAGPEPGHRRAGDHRAGDSAAQAQAASRKPS